MTKEKKNAYYSSMGSLHDHGHFSWYSSYTNCNQM